MANEGFWPFNRIPRAAIKQALGVELSDQWTARVQQASVRFPGGSGLFVSPDGLVFDGNIKALPVVYKADAIVKELVAGATPAAR